jgi:LruC domain-containing protein
MEDTSDPGTGKYFKTKNGLPWAIHIYQSFDYPIEKSPVNEAYLHFNEWATSSGSTKEGRL